MHIPETSPFLKCDHLMDVCTFFMLGSGERITPDNAWSYFWLCAQDFLSEELETIRDAVVEPRLAVSKANVLPVVLLVWLFQACSLAL